MKKTIRKSLFTLLLGTALAVPTAFAETDKQAFDRAIAALNDAQAFSRAVAAYNAGNYQTAFPIFQRFAEQGGPGGQYNLGLMYYNGYGVRQNYQQAAKWWTKAAEQGHTQAQLSLGGMYKDGTGVHQDYQQAAKWFTKAAEQGDAQAQFWLGAMYYIADYDFAMAEKYWSLACNNGYQEGCEMYNKVFNLQ